MRKISKQEIGTLVTGSTVTFEGIKGKFVAATDDTIVLAYSYKGKLSRRSLKREVTSYTMPEDITILSGCEFCEIVDGERKNAKLFENELVYAFLDHQPITKGHTLVVPKTHVMSYFDVPNYTQAAMADAAGKIQSVLQSELMCKGTNVLINDNIAAGQEVLHAHMHLIPRYARDGFGLRMPPSYSTRKPKEPFSLAKKLQQLL